jgi:Ribonuclease P/MRP, subunit p29
MLQKADFHGALLKVVRSKCSSLVGVQGIILMDTKGTFQIICKDNRVKSELTFESLRLDNNVLKMFFQSLPNIPVSLKFCLKILPYLCLVNTLSASQQKEQQRR